MQQTSGMTALHNLSTTSDIVTSPSPCAEPAEAPAEPGLSPSQDELSPVAPPVSPVATQPTFDAETAEETSLPPKSGNLTQHYEKKQYILFYFSEMSLLNYVCLRLWIFSPRKKTAKEAVTQGAGLYHRRSVSCSFKEEGLLD